METHSMWRWCEIYGENFSFYINNVASIDNEVFALKPEFLTLVGLGPGLVKKQR